MKKTTLGILASLFISVTAQAEMVNLDFENQYCDAVLAINNTVNDIRFNPDEMVVFKHFIIKGLIEGNSPEETANVITNHPLAKS